MTDRALVEDAIAGSPEAYDLVARSCARRLYQVAYRVLRDSDAAEDALQHALVKVWQELPRLRDPDRFDAWSYRIVMRAAFAEAKRQKRSRRVVERVQPEPSTPDGSSALAQRDDLERAFEQLSADARAVIVLRYYADLPLTEIAYILGVPYGTVGSRLHRALREMRSAMDRDEPPPGAPAGGDEPELMKATTP